MFKILIRPPLYMYIYLHEVCTECSLNIVFFPRILGSLPPLPRQNSTAIGCTIYYQPIGVTVLSHCVERLKFSYSDVGEGGVPVNCEKTQYFLNTLYLEIRQISARNPPYVHWKSISYPLEIRWISIRKSVYPLEICQESSGYLDIQLPGFPPWTGYPKSFLKT